MSTELRRLGAGIVEDLLYAAPTDPAKDALVKSIRFTNANDVDSATLNLKVIRPSDQDERRLLPVDMELSPHFQLIWDEDLTLAPGYELRATATFPTGSPGPNEVHFLIFGIEREV